MWDLLSLQTRSHDSVVQNRQFMVIKAACNIVKLVDKLDKMKSSNDSDDLQNCIDLGINSLGLLGHYNRQTNIKRRDFHKPDLDSQYHHLCTPSQPFTDHLYGDDVPKNVQEIQNFNRIGRKIFGFGRGFDRGFGRGRGKGYERGVSRGKRGGLGRGRGRGLDRHADNNGGQVGQFGGPKNYKNLQRN